MMLFVSVTPENKYAVAIIVSDSSYNYDDVVSVQFVVDRDYYSYYGSTTIQELRHDQILIQVPDQQEHLDVPCSEYQNSDDCELQS